MGTTTRPSNGTLSGTSSGSANGDAGGNGGGVSTITSFSTELGERLGVQIRHRSAHRVADQDGAHQAEAVDEPCDVTAHLFKAVGAGAGASAVAPLVESDDTPAVGERIRYFEPVISPSGQSMEQHHWLCGGEARYPIAEGQPTQPERVLADLRHSPYKPPPGVESSSAASEGYSRPKCAAMGGPISWCIRARDLAASAESDAARVARRRSFIAGTSTLSFSVPASASKLAHSARRRPSTFAAATERPR